MVVDLTARPKVAEWGGTLEFRPFFIWFPYLFASNFSPVIQSAACKTLEFTRALNLIVEKLKARELIRVWEPLIDTRADGVIAEEVKNRFSTLIFSSNAGYARLLDLAPTRKILEKLNIAQVYEPARLGTIIAAISSSAQLQQIWGNGYSYAAFYSLTEQLWSLVRMESACRSLLEEEKKGKIDPFPGRKILAFRREFQSPSESDSTHR